MTRYRLAGYLWTVSNKLAVWARWLDTPNKRVLECKHCIQCGQWYWMEVFHECRAI